MKHPLIFCVVTSLLLSYNDAHSIVKKVDFGKWDGRGGMSARTFLCFDNVSPPASVSMIGSGPKGDFTLTNGSELLDYDVFVTTNGGRQALLPGEAYTDWITARLPTCRRGLTVRMLFLIRRRYLAPKSAGLYTGELTVTVSPE